MIIKNTSLSFRWSRNHLWWSANLTGESGVTLWAGALLNPGHIGALKHLHFIPLWSALRPAFTRKFENRKRNFSLNLEKWLFSLRKSAVQQSFVDLLTSFIFTFPVVCLSPWSHLHLSPSYHVLDHIFTESLSSGDNNDREEYLQKDKYKGKDTHTQTNTKCF